MEAHFFGNELYCKYSLSLLDVIIEKCLANLKLAKAPREPPRTRVWWCPTGKLSFLPLHAAKSALENVISSYTPTVNSLLEAQHKAMPVFQRCLVVGMSKTPSNVALPNVEREVLQVKKQMEKCFNIDGGVVKLEMLHNEEAVKAEVLGKMETANWVHFACHSVQDSRKPVESGPVLYDKHLMIKDMVSQCFLEADFAYLSGCETATGDVNTADEAIHIAAGMLSAGYRSVIGDNVGDWGQCSSYCL